MERKFTIQEIATRTGLSAHTLRYYEKIGLLRHVSRGENGYRTYTEREVAWIEFLICLRDMGMSIQQMIQFSELRYQGDETIPNRRHLLESFKKEVEERVTLLQQNLGAIRNKIEIYKEWEKDGKRNEQSL